MKADKIIGIKNGPEALSVTEPQRPTYVEVTKKSRFSARRLINKHFQ